MGDILLNFGAEELPAELIVKTERNGDLVLTTENSDYRQQITGFSLYSESGKEYHLTYTTVEDFILVPLFANS